MELFEYIKSQLPQMPNVQIMKDMGASDELVEYVKESPENTNLNVIGSINGSDGGDVGEVWFTGTDYDDENGIRTFYLSSVDSTDKITELYTNASNYDVFLNDTNLPYMTKVNAICAWADSEEPQNTTKSIVLNITDSENKFAQAYMDASTAPTSVEVSVKAK